MASAVGVNFGELRASEISGKVYRDDNNNGLVNGTEPGLAGVPVTLSGLDDLGQTVLLSTTTDANGNYSFTGLRPSCSPLAAPACPGYVITEGTQPANTANGIATAGSVSDLSSGAAIGVAGTGSNNAPAANGAPEGTSRIAGIVLPSNARSANNNFGELGSNRSVSGQVFTDGNGDGVLNGSDAGVGTGATGVNNQPQTLTLTGADANGNPVS